MLSMPGSLFSPFPQAGSGGRFPQRSDSLFCLMPTNRNFRRMAATVGACLLALGASRAAGQQRSTSPDSAAIVELEHTWLSHGDSATLERILAPDFLHPVASGQIIDRAEHIAWVASHPAPPTAHARFERLDVRLFGDIAIATGIVAARRVGATAPRRTVFTDVFARRHGRWEAVSAQETPVSHE